MSGISAQFDAWMVIVKCTVFCIWNVSENAFCCGQEGVLKECVRGSWSQFCGVEL